RRGRDGGIGPVHSVEGRVFMKQAFAAAAAVIAFALPAEGADIEAGRATVARVCAACHGAEGVSVADNIPNLGGQRARYLEEQLRLLKSGTRRNGIMNPIAAQLSQEEIANIAAYFSSRAGAGSATSSDFLPNIAKTNVAFPD